MPEERNGMVMDTKGGRTKGGRPNNSERVRTLPTDFVNICEINGPRLVPPYWVVLTKLKAQNS